MDTSSSSEELSSSECDIESSCEDDSEKLETAKICGATLELPQGLCESKDIFKEFFSLKTWNSLSEINKQHLKNFLPCFPENDDQEKNVTLQRLFNKERFRFNSPLMQFHEKLNAGHFRPDIAKMRSLMKHAQRKEYKYQQQQHCKQLMSELVTSRQRLLDVSSALPPGIEPRVEKQPAAHVSVCPAAYRAKRRYFQELATIKSLVGESVEWSEEDENYPEGPPVQLSKKQRRHLNGLQVGTNVSAGVERAVTSTLATKPHGFDLESSVTASHNPYQLTEDSYRALLSKHKKRRLESDVGAEMVTKGVSLRDVAQRTQLTPTKKSNNGGKVAPLVHSESRLSKKKIKVEAAYRPVNNVSHHSPDTITTTTSITTSTSTTTITATTKHHGGGRTASAHPSSSNSEPDNSDSDSIIDPVQSPLPMAAKCKSPRARTPRPKQTSPRSSSSSKGKTPPASVALAEYEPVAVHTEFEPIQVKTDPEAAVPGSLASADSLASPVAQYGSRIMPATLSDLDGIDMMNLPVDLDDSNIDILEEISVKQELMQDTHANFLSLVRDIICSTLDHRMSMGSLEDRLKAWQENPISPLNDWYSLVDSWVTLLASAVTFLSGESNEQPDDFVPYLEFKPTVQAYQWIGAGRDSDQLLSPLCQYWLEHRDDTVLHSGAQDVEIDVVEKPQTPPPPRCPTQWSVRKAEPAEIEQFREQERQRYSNPHKAFTYRMNGYESVVGPVKGMYNQSAGVSKARGHSMLNADRPNFVTILTLVRDATARLPNGEGTRAEICELLKSSQYISQTAPENVLQSVVSGALDRMHTEFDPCVKYDTKRKTWIYLHRNRSEADFERIHQQCQGMSKQLKKATRKPKAKPAKEKPAKQTAHKTEMQVAVSVGAAGTPSGAASPLDKAVRTFKTPVCRVFSVPTVSVTSASVQQAAAAAAAVATTSAVSPSRPAAGTSLLMNPSIVKQSTAPKLHAHADKVDSPMKTLLAPAASTGQASPPVQADRQLKIVASTIAPTKQDIEEAIQTLTPIRVASPSSKQVCSPKVGKSLVKIINSPQGKSLIAATANPQQHQQQQQQQQQQTVFIKQVEQKTVSAKQLLAQPQLTQQLLQSIAAQQQKQLKQQVVQLAPPKQVVSSAQQLLKAVEQKPAQSVASPQLIQTVPHTGAPTNISQQILQAITQQKHNQPSAQQQQQILQTLKQKVAQQNQQTVLTVQQAVLKQQANMHQLQKQLQQQQQMAKGTSLLGQQRILAQVGTAKATGAPNQTPLVAKVLTNAAGQVISVESLLAHQKQHGSLPQGTTLRVSGAKPGQTNLIQLSGTAPNQVAQFAVVSQNNIVSIAGQQRLISTVTSQPPTTTSTVTVVTTAKALSKNHHGSKPQAATKFVSSKLTHQLVNAKFITAQNSSKLLPQQKIVVNQQQQQQNQLKISAAVKPVAVTKTVASSNQAGNTVRMVNAASLNLAHIAGKPVLLASKGNTIQNIQGQNVILQTQSGISTSSGSLVLPSNARVVTQQQQQGVQQSQAASAQVVLGTQLKMQNVGQNTSHVVLGHNLKPQGNVSLAAQQASPNQTVVLGGHTIKVQAGGGAQSNQRVVLASQGQGGQLVAQQILLPPGFQGGAINIKTLQGLKVIPLAQTQQTKGRPQQVFARIMNPASASRITQVTSSPATEGGGSTGGAKE